MTQCVERSRKAIVQSQRLLANSEALLNYPESNGCGALDPALERTKQPASGVLPIISKRDFDSEFVSADGKHFCDCSFLNCTLVYRGFPVIFESCQFHNCKFEFSGEAGRTVQFLDCFGLLTRGTPDQTNCNPDDEAPEFVN